MRGRPKGTPDKRPRQLRRTNVQAASQTLRALFGAATSEGVGLASIAAHLDRTSTSVSYWRSGRSTPTILDVEELADLLGYEIKLVKKENAT